MTFALRRRASSLLKRGAFLTPNLTTYAPIRGVIWRDEAIPAVLGIGADTRI
jgi:hypothetical protein